MNKPVSILLLLTAFLAVTGAASLRGEERDMPDTRDETPGSPFSQAKFVPDISLVLDASYVHRNTRDEKYSTLRSPELTLAPADEAWHGHDEPWLHRGFNFNYAEITFYSIVDPYLELFAVCHLAPDHAGLEEAYFTTRSLPLGLQFKAGRFLSHFGRLNEQHAHCWDFADAPLVHNAFLGNGGLDEIGVRITCVLPTDFYLMIGGEMLQGSNTRTFGNGKIVHADGSVVTDGSNGPNLGVGYVKTSFDIGDLTVLAGASGACGKARINHGLDRAGKEGAAYAGDAFLVGGDITLKYLIDSVRFVSLQAEYIYRGMEGDLYRNDGSDVMSTGDFRRRQSGICAQLVAKFSKRWRCGARYDLLNLNRAETNGTEIEVPEKLPRYTVMFEFNPTEFSRFRIQYNCDASRYGIVEGRYERKINHEVIVQANLAIGAHGAHSF